MIRIIFPLVTFLATMILPQIALAQAKPETFRDWSVVCDNVKTCMAFSTSSRSEGGLAVRPRGIGAQVNEGWMSIERAGGPQSVPRILLSRPDLSAVSLASNAEIHLVGPNGRPVPRGVFAATMGNRAAIEIPASVNSEFLRVARGANHAILVVGQVKRPVFFVSLSGLVASGRNIDARQGRTNTMGALIDVGRIANIRVPDAPALPIATALSFTKRNSITPSRAILSRRDAECGDAQRFDPGGGGIEAFDMGQGRTLWSVPCGAGSYNTWNRFYIAPARGELMRPQFARVIAIEGQDDINITNAIIDPLKGTIASFSKARGLGDCGISEIFAWDGREFVLVQSREMLPCGGIIEAFWPTSYQASVVIGRRR